MKTSEVKDTLMYMMEYKGQRKYIGKQEEEALRIAIGCINMYEKLKAEVNAQYWDEYEVR